MKVALVVDNPYRDLPGLILLARELASRGVTCYMVPYNRIEPELWALAPDFVALNFVRRANEDFIDRLTNAGIKVGILDTEGSIFVPVPTDSLEDIATAEHIRDKTTNTINTYLITVARNPRIRRKVSVYLAWSDEVADFLSNNGLFERSQLKVTGSPRSDLLSDRFRPAVRAISSEYAGQFKQPMVLINASSPVANPAFFTMEQEIGLMVKMFHYKWTYVEGLAEAQTQGLREITRIANELARTFPNVDFVLRPHPFENLSTYRFLLDRRPNLFLRKQGTVDGWLSRARCLVQAGSSTAVEAAAFGIPCFTPNWVPLFAPVPVSNLASETIDSMEELKQKLQATLENRFVLSEQKKKDIATAIHMAHGSADGKAHERCCEAIMEVLNAEPLDQVKTITGCRREAYYASVRGPRWRRWLHLQFCRLLGRSIHWSWKRFRSMAEKELPWDKTEKRFDAALVNYVLTAFESVKPNTEEKIVAVPATDDYHFGYHEGRAVIVKRI